MKNAVQGTATRVLVARNGRPIEDDLMALLSTPCFQVLVTLEGFAGDKHSGLTCRSGVRTPHYPRGTEIRNTRQVSIVSVEELAQVAAVMGVPSVLPEWLGANLAIQGIPDLTRLPPSTRVFFPQDTVLVVDGENKPCVWPGRVIQTQYPHLQGLAQQFPKAAIRQRGVVAWVERPGMVAEGDRVVARIPPQVIYSIPAAPVRRSRTQRAPATADRPVLVGV